MKKILLSALLVGALTACSGKDDTSISLPADAQPINLTAAQQTRVMQDNTFAFDLLRQTITDHATQSNVFVSPLSVSMALGMVLNGANSTTRTEMESALRMSGLTGDEINSYYKLMLSTLPAIDPTTKLTIANSVWYRSGFSVMPAFLSTNSEYFHAYIRSLDFAQSWAKDTINNWCARNTNNLIPSIVDQIDPDVVMYLVNAVYFKGIWRNKFDKKLTAERDFTNDQQTKVKVNMMYRKDVYGYTYDDKAKYLDMPYGNKAFSMTLILPQENISVAEVLQSVTTDSWNETLKHLYEQEVEVYLPRLKVTNEFSLNQVLQDMGMKTAFTDRADFSKLSSQSVKVSEVKHKTYITVDEEGAEAAAVTSVAIVTTAVPVVPVVNINKPFLFVIRENSTGVILFVGKVGNPEKY